MKRFSSYKHLFHHLPTNTTSSLGRSYIRLTPFLFNPNLNDDDTTPKILAERQARSGIAKGASSKIQMELKDYITHNMTEVLGPNEARINESKLEMIRQDKKGFIVDLDGTLWVTLMNGDNKALKGARQFVEWVLNNDRKIILLTNGSMRNNQALVNKFERLINIRLEDHHFINSCESVATFIANQSPNARCFMLGEPALREALERAGLEVVEDDPQYVVMGEAKDYKELVRGLNFVNRGARFIATNSDTVDIMDNSDLYPSTGSFVKIIASATGIEPYFLGKPNNLMLRAAVDRLGLRHRECVVVGDRMNTDILCATEARMDSVLVLTGVTAATDISRFAYKPTCVLNSVEDIVF